MHCRNMMIMHGLPLPQWMAESGQLPFAPFLAAAAAAPRVPPPPYHAGLQLPAMTVVSSVPYEAAGAAAKF